MDSPGQTLSLKPEKFEMDLGPSSSGLRGRRRTYFTILKRAWSADSFNGKVSYPVTSEAGAICHSKITTKSEKGNLIVWLL
jgi:hypothetical protein